MVLSSAMSRFKSRRIHIPEALLHVPETGLLKLNLWELRLGDSPQTVCMHADAQQAGRRVDVVAEGVAAPLGEVQCVLGAFPQGLYERKRAHCVCRQTRQPTGNSDFLVPSTSRTVLP